MALSIKDRETDELARELAARTGQSLTEAVRTALRERLDRELHGSEAGLANRLVRIGRRCAEQMRGPFSSADHGELFYDERGLPR